MFGSIARVFFRYQYKKYIPKDPKSSDLYLVEFPKSGVTWLSTILANTALIHSGMDERATFYNVSQYIPDIHMTGRNVGERSYITPRYRIIKSHAEYNPYYLHTIYLVRHPVSVMRSYYTFLAQNNQALSNIREFLEDKRFGLSVWKRHVNSWLKTNNQASRLHLVRYEDLIADTQQEIADINKNLGLGLVQDTINCAISLSDVRSMKKSEELYSTRNPRYRLSFVRGPREKFSSDVVDFINRECGSELRLLGYSR